MGEEERDAGREGGKEGGCIILSAGDEKQAGEEGSDVISAPFAKQGDREAQSHTPKYRHLHAQKHTPDGGLRGDIVAGLCQHRMSQTNWGN